MPERNRWTLTMVLFISVLYTEPFPSKTAFKRTAEGVHRTRCARCETENGLRTRHECLFANGKLYFLSLKGKRQPNYGSYHETALHGGYLSIYSSPGGRNGNWSHIHFDPIDKTENREQAFFQLNKSFFLLLYTRFENVTYRRLLQWNQQSEWIDVQLRVDERSEFLDGDILNGAIAWTIKKGRKRDGNGTEELLYLTATDGWGRIKVSSLRINFGDNRAVSAGIDYLMEDEGSEVNSAGAIVALAYRSGKLFAFYGTQGCGFHWEKRRLIIIDLNTSSIDHVNLEYRSPPWAFSGPALIEQDGPNWMMFGGSVAVGEMRSEFDTRIWTFNLDTRRWRKAKTRMPDQLNIYDTCSAIDRQGRTVYLADYRNIYKAKLDQLHD